LNSGKDSSIVYQHGRLEEIKEEKNKREIKRILVETKIIGEGRKQLKIILLLALQNGKGGEIGL
jgi:hypothetical protein